MSNEFEVSDDLPIPSELESLKSRAEMMGVKFHPSISLEKLKEKVNAKVSAESNDEPETEKEEDKPVVTKSAVKAGEPVEETLAQRRVRKKREANELIRLRVTCMNPAKKEWPGEIFTAGNSLVGTFKKYVPFNADEGWHVPRMIYNQIVQRQCQIFTSVRDSRGNSTRKGRLIKEFAIEILPNLTAEDLTELARRQAMSKSID